MDECAKLVSEKFITIAQVRDSGIYQKKQYEGNPYELWDDLDDENVNQATSYAIETAQIMSQALNKYYSERGNMYAEVRDGSFETLRAIYREARKESESKFKQEIIGMLQELTCYFGGESGGFHRKTYEGAKKREEEEEEGEKKRGSVWR